LKKQQGNEKSHTIEGDKINSAIDGLIEKLVLTAWSFSSIISFLLIVTSDKFAFFDAATALILSARS